MSKPKPFPIRPMHTRVIVKRVEPETKYNMIYLPDKHQEKPQEGIVVAAGPGDRVCNNVEHPVYPPDVKVGDRVFFTKYGGVEFDWDDEKYIALLEEDIIMILPPDGQTKVRGSKGQLL